MKDPCSQLLHSRKFLILVLDVVLSAVFYFGSKYAGESLFADIKFLIGLLQPVFLTLIYAISSETNAAVRAQGEGPRDG